MKLSTCSPLVVSLGSLVLLALVGTTEGVKLQNYLNPESSVVDPEVRASILDRQGKQFQIYTTTSTTTSTSTATFSTNTMCWITDPANALAANTNCMFKRRAIEDGPLVGVDEVERLIKPSSVKTQEQLDVEESLESSGLLANLRAPKILNDLLFSTSSVTATSVTTLTTFSSTNTVTVLCTPLFAACPAG